MLVALAVVLARLIGVLAGLMGVLAGLGLRAMRCCLVAMRLRGSPIEPTLAGVAAYARPS
jgi:hypothetical protein